MPVKMDGWQFKPESNVTEMQQTIGMGPLPVLSRPAWP